MQKRWYDIDPTVSLAVSLMKSANEQTQLQCAEYIITKSKNFGVNSVGPSSKLKATSFFLVFFFVMLLRKYPS